MIGSKWLAALEWGIREDLSEKVTFKLRPNEQERASHVKVFLGKLFQVEALGNVKLLKQEQA